MWQTRNCTVQFQRCKKLFLAPLHTILLGTTNSVPPLTPPPPSCLIFSQPLSPSQAKGCSLSQAPLFPPCFSLILGGSFCSFVFFSTCSHNHVHCCVPRAAVMLGDPTGGAADPEAQVGFPKATHLRAHVLVRFRQHKNGREMPLWGRWQQDECLNPWLGWLELHPCHLQWLPESDECNGETETVSVRSPPGKEVCINPKWEEPGNVHWRFGERDWNPRGGKQHVWLPWFWFWVWRLPIKGTAKISSTFESSER